MFYECCYVIQLLNPVKILWCLKPHQKEEDTKSSYKPAGKISILIVVVLAPL